MEMQNTGIVPTLPINNGDGFGFGGDGIWALLIFAMIYSLPSSAENKFIIHPSSVSRG